MCTMSTMSSILSAAFVILVQHGGFLYRGKGVGVEVRYTWTIGGVQGGDADAAGEVKLSTMLTVAVAVAMALPVSFTSFGGVLHGIRAAQEDVNVLLRRSNCLLSCNCEVE